MAKNNVNKETIGDIISNLTLINKLTVAINAPDFDKHEQYIREIACVSIEELVVSRIDKIRKEIEEMTGLKYEEAEEAYKGISSLDYNLYTAKGIIDEYGEKLPEKRLLFLSDLALHINVDLAKKGDKLVLELVKEALPAMQNKYDELLKELSK